MLGERGGRGGGCQLGGGGSVPHHLLRSSGKAHPNLGPISCVMEADQRGKQPVTNEGAQKMPSLRERCSHGTALTTLTAHPQGRINSPDSTPPG